MKLEFIALDRLAVSKANMRHGRKAPDVSDILPTVRTRGVLQPILVRPARDPGHFEIVAGRRRFHAASIVAAERAAAVAAGSAAPDAVVAVVSGPPEPPEPCMRPDTGLLELTGARGVAPLGGSTEGTPAGPPAGLPEGSPVAPGGVCDLLACAVLDEADDAAAIEASLIENIARLDPDEVSRWECFTRLVREGRSPEQIGQTFGLPDLAVRRVLALGNLLPRIRDLYRREDIDAVTVRHLTLASKSQQKAWLALVDDADAWVPRGHQLKSWLFGGHSIPVRHALFDVGTSGLAVIADLFGEDPLFAQADAFWVLQNAAIEARRVQYLEAGWSDAIVIDPNDHFHSWEYEKAPKRKGARVYIDVRGNGEVIAHEGYVTRKEAARLARSAEAGGDDGEGKCENRGSRPELTAATRGYVDLHRHAAVRAGLLDKPGTALRLLVAHAIAGSPLWRIGIEPQATKNDAVRESVAQSRGESAFDTRRRAMLARMGCDPDDATLVGGTGWGLPDRDLPGIFARLLALPDPDVLDVVGIVMGETLGAGGSALECAGREIGLDMADWWEPDDAFFDGLRDREVLLAMLAEVAGSDIAQANAREKGATIKSIIRDHLAGDNGRARRGKWVPRWMAFPLADYTARGIHACAAASDLRTSVAQASSPDDEPEPEAGAGPAIAGPSDTGLSGAHDADLVCEVECERSGEGAGSGEGVNEGKGEGNTGPDTESRGCDDDPDTGGNDNDTGEPDLAA